MDKADRKYDYMTYPHFDVSAVHGLLPSVGLPHDYLLLVPKFFKSDGIENISRYTCEVQNAFKEASILDVQVELNWDDSRGLKNISIGTHGGYDLDDRERWPSFVTHNLSVRNGFLAFCIATQYVLELLKQRE